MNVSSYKLFVKRIMTDSLAIFDISTGGGVVSFVCNKKKPSDAYDSLCDITHRFEKELNDVLLSYESTPVFLSEKEAIALVLPSFVASTGMYLTVMPRATSKSLSFAIKNGILDNVIVFGELPTVIRASKRTREEAELLREWLDNFCLCFAPRNENDSLIFSELLRERILNISEYIGVNVRTVALGNIRENDKLDLGLFLAFVTVMLMITRIRSRDGSALISIGEDDHGIFVKFEFPFEEQDPRYDKEMVAFKGMADRKRVLFEALEKDGAVSVKMSPIIEDWALLELKVPDNEEIEFELT